MPHVSTGDDAEEAEEERDSERSVALLADLQIGYTTKIHESTIIIDVNPWHRIPLVCVNLVVFVFCSIVVFACIISIVDRRDEISFRNRSLLISFVVNIEIPALVGSGLVHATSFMGFIGGLRENVCLLRWYQKATYALLGLDVLFMAMCFAVPFVSRSSVQDAFSIDLIVSYRDNPDYARLVDYTQESFMCCGVTRNRYRDWDQNIYFNCSKSNPSAERCSVPASCCRPITVLKKGGEVDPEVRLRRRFCGKGVLAITEQRAWEKVFTRSCVDAFVAYIRSNITIMIGACLVTFAVVALLRSMASTVCGEIISLTDLYNKYYRNVAKGYRQSLRRRQALQAEARAKDLMVMEMTKPESRSTISPKEDQITSDYFGPPQPKFYSAK
ncbi:tetraspanin-33-like [Amblyomma americanum]